MLPKKERNKNVMKCSCGYKEVQEESVKIVEKKQVEEKQVEVIDSNEEDMPICKEKCEKCGNEEAYYTIQQTRSADESPTKFMKCTKCKHTWRDYD